jgi:cytochrome P450
MFDGSPSALTLYNLVRPEILADPYPFYHQLRSSDPVHWDPAQFPTPDRLDLSRRENRHVAFGQRVHFCLGAALARLEGQIAIRTLLSRFQALRLESDALEWRANQIVRGLKSLPVLF